MMEKQVTGIYRWWMLFIISLGFIELTLNWFDIASGFGEIGKSLNVGLPQLGLLISLFLLGYGVFHIPSGLLATRWGLKKTMVLGLFIESAGGLFSGMCNAYPQLAIMRVITGIGGSVFVGCGFAMANVWFRKHNRALALGITGGAAFSVGAAIGLFPWVGIVQSTGWNNALFIGGGIGLLITIVTMLFMKTPPEDSGLTGSKITAESIRNTLGSKDLWMIGLGILGAYGAYFTASQLLAEFVIKVDHFTAGQGGAISAIMVLAGIPGGVIGGWCSDIVDRRLPFLIYPLWAQAVALLLIPFVHGPLIWIIAFLIGFLLLFSFSAWCAMPGGYSYIRSEDIATAEGLMLTLAAVGGFIVPVAFGYIAGMKGFTAGWVFLAAVTFVFSLLYYLANEPDTEKVSTPSSLERAITSG